MAIEIDENTILRLLVRRGSEAERSTIILAQGEPGFTLDGKVLVVGDGVTPGGIKIPNVDGNTISWSGTTPNYLQVADGGISNTKFADMSANSIKGNNTSTDGQPTDVVTASNSIVGRLDSYNSGNLASIPLGTFFGNIFSISTPDPTLTGVWFNLNNYKWYQYDGANWLSKHQYDANGPVRLLYVGTGASVETFDGGTSTAQSVSGGPMWEIDTDYTSKVLRGAALGSLATLPLGSGGADNITLVASMLPPHTHNVKILIPGHGGQDGLRDAADGGTFSSPNSSDPSFNWTNTTDGVYPGVYSKDNKQLPYVYEDYGNGSTSTTTPTQVSTIPSYKEVLIIKRTSRVYYVA